MTARVEHSSERHDWQTPDEVLERVRKVAPIWLDPCTVAENPTGAHIWIAPPTDALAMEWSENGSGLTYINPPYGRALGAWSERIAMEAAMRREIIALVPARPETQWFRRMRLKSDVVAFAERRIKFKGATDTAPFPSAFFYYGTRISAFRDAFGDMCWFSLGE